MEIPVPEPVAVLCQCGQQFAAQPHLFGKTVPCPACGRQLTIPEPGEQRPVSVPNTPNLGGLLDEVGLTASQTGRRCPKCRADMKPEAKICLGCGYNVELGRQMDVRVEGERKDDWDIATAEEGAPPADSARFERIPAWERRPFTPSGFIETTVEVFSAPGYFFGTTRRTGHLWAALSYPMLTGLVASLLTAVYGVVYQASQTAGAAAGSGMTVLIVGLGGAVAIPLLLWINAGLIHVAVVLVGGARKPFDATFRVTAYSAGASYLPLVIPFVGPIVGIVLFFVLLGVGIAASHEIKLGRAAAAVVGYSVFCLGLGIALWLAIASILVMGL